MSLDIDSLSPEKRAALELFLAEDEPAEAPTSDETEESAVDDGSVEVTALGVTARVWPKRIDDFNLMRKLHAASKGDAEAASESMFMLLERLCGDDLDRICDELSDDDGILPTERVSEWLNAVQEQLGALKNS